MRRIAGPISKTSTTARPQRARLWLAARLTVLMLAGISILTAVPASAAPALARSVASGAVQERTAALASSTSGPAAFFGLGPSSATKIDNRPYFAWGSTPGAAFADYAAVVNFGTQPVTLQVFATNAVSLAHGGTGFLPQGRILGGPASWITLHLPGGSSTVHLGPKSQVIVPITVSIPKNAPPGDHVGAIVASLTSSAVAKNHAKVHLIQQVASRTVIRVSGPIHPQLSVDSLSVEYNDPLNPASSSTATLRFTVRNTGNVLLGGKESVAVHGLFGGSASVTNAAQIPIMLPGGSTTEIVKVHGVYPELLMHGDVTIKPLVVAGQDDPGLRTYSASVTFWAIPWIPVAILIVIVLLIVLLIWRRRRRRPSPAPDGPAPVASTTGVEA